MLYKFSHAFQKPAFLPITSSIAIMNINLVSHCTFYRSRDATLFDIQITDVHNAITGVRADRQARCDHVGLKEGG